MRRYTLFAALAAMAGMPLRVPAQSLSLGLIGGGSLTDAVQTETLYNIRTWSPSEDWIAGATFELHFRSRFSVEVDGMYRELHATRVGQTIVFCRLSGVAARREPDRPRKTMVCPTSRSLGCFRNSVDPCSRSTASTAASPVGIAAVAPPPDRQPMSLGFSTLRARPMGRSPGTGKAFPAFMHKNAPIACA